MSADDAALLDGTRAGEQVWSSRRERLEHERTGTREARPARAPRSGHSARSERSASRAAAVEAKNTRREVKAKRVVAARATPAPTAVPHGMRGAFARLRGGDRRRFGFHAVVFLALSAFFGTAALPAYATSDTASVEGDTRVALAVQTLTGGGAATIQTVARDAFSTQEAAIALDSTQNNYVSPTVQALATQLMGAVATGRLVGSIPDHIPEIANLAEGKAVPDCGIDYRVLQAISVALAHYRQVGVSDINRRCTGQIEGAGTDSSHYADGGGHAVDFYLLDGQALTGGDAKSVELIRYLDPLVPAGSGLGQVGCRESMSLTNFVPFDDTCNHLHIDFGKAQGVALTQ
ncbi:hypothetical protein [Leifsonia poae]|uniref:Uncharacterized protein n=1 Tax=Leifsonia poae TaxID=110933 RepID=A0A9W6H8M7_9MICO|nr:hypothetical protein [Leifsonia poae]GLJ75919.1 hypothetical protein GCM10017584_14930 [Leifsonia poae]